MSNAIATSLSASYPRIPRQARSPSPPLLYDTNSTLYLNLQKVRPFSQPPPQSCSHSPSGTCNIQTSTDSGTSTSFTNFQRSIMLNPAASTKFIDKVAEFKRKKKKNKQEKDLLSPGRESSLPSLVDKIGDEMAMEISSYPLKGKVLHVVDDGSNQCLHASSSIHNSSALSKLQPLVSPQKHVDDECNDDTDDDLNFPFILPDTMNAKVNEDRDHRIKAKTKENTKAKVHSLLSENDRSEPVVLEDGPKWQLKSCFEHEPGFASNLHIPASSSDDDDCASWIEADPSCGFKIGSKEMRVSLEEEEGGIFSMEERRDMESSFNHMYLDSTRASELAHVHDQRRSSPSVKSSIHDAKRHQQDSAYALQNRFQELFCSNRNNELYDANSIKKLKKHGIKDSLKLSENMEKTLECLESSLNDHSEGIGESLYQREMNVERRLVLTPNSCNFPPEAPSKIVVEEIAKEYHATKQRMLDCAFTSGSRTELFGNYDDFDYDDGDDFDGTRGMHRYYPTLCQNESWKHLDNSAYDQVRASEKPSKGSLQQGKEIQVERLGNALKLKKMVKFNDGNWDLARSVEPDDHLDQSSNPSVIQTEGKEAPGMNTPFLIFGSACDQLGKLQTRHFVDKDIDRYTCCQHDDDVDDDADDNEDADAHLKDDPDKKHGFTLPRNAFSQDAMSDSSLSSSASCGAKAEPCNHRSSRSPIDSLGRHSSPASISSLISRSQHPPFKFSSRELYNNIGASSNPKEMTFCNPVFDYDSTLSHKLPDYDDVSRPMLDPHNANDEVFKSMIDSSNFLIEEHINSWLSKNIQTKLKQQVEEAVTDSMKKFEERIKIDIGNVKEEMMLESSEKKTETELGLMMERKLEKHFALLMETVCAGKDKVISEIQSELCTLQRESEGLRAETLDRMEMMMVLVEKVKSRLNKEKLSCKDDEAFREELEIIRKDGIEFKCILDDLKKDIDAQLNEVRLAIDKLNTDGIMLCKEQISGMQNFEKLLYKDHKDVKKVTKNLESAWKDSRANIEKNRLSILKIEKELKDTVDDLGKSWKEDHFKSEKGLNSRVGDLQNPCKQSECGVESLKEFIGDFQKGNSMLKSEADLKNVVQTFEKSFKQGFSDLEMLKKFKDDVEKGKRIFSNSEVTAKQGTLIMERVEGLSQLYLGGLEEVRTEVQNLKSHVQAKFSELQRHGAVSKQKREESTKKTPPRNWETRILELEHNHSSINKKPLEDKIEDIMKRKSEKLEDDLNFDKEASPPQLERIEMCADIQREKEVVVGAASTAKKKIQEVVREFENELAKLQVTRSRVEKEKDSVRNLSEDISGFVMKAKNVLNEMTELRQKTLKLSDEVLSELTHTEWKNASTSHRCVDMYKKVLTLEGSQLDLSSKLDDCLDKTEELEKSVAEWVPKYDAAARFLNEVENRLEKLETSSPNDMNEEKRVSELVDKDPFGSYYKHFPTQLNRHEVRWLPLEPNRSLTNLDTEKKGIGMSDDARIVVVESRIEHVASATYTNLRILDTRVQHITGNVETALKCATMAEKKCNMLGAELVKVFRMLASSAKPHPGKRHVSPSKEGGDGGDSHHQHLPKTEAFRIRRKSPLSRAQSSQKKELPIVKNKHSDEKSVECSEKNGERNRQTLHMNESLGTISSSGKFTTLKSRPNIQPSQTRAQGNGLEASNKKAYNMACHNVKLLDSGAAWPVSESISVELKHRDRQALSKLHIDTSAASNPESSNSHCSPIKNSKKTDFRVVSGRKYVNASQRSRLFT